MWLIDFHARHIVSINEKEILYCSWEGAEVIEKHSSVWKTSVITVKLPFY